MKIKEANDGVIWLNEEIIAAPVGEVLPIVHNLTNIIAYNLHLMMTEKYSSEYRFKRRMDTIKAIINEN